MKPFTQNLLVSSICSIISVCVFVGLLWGIDTIEDRRNAEANKPLNEKVLEYFEENGITYEQLDSLEYQFIHNDFCYTFLFDGSEYMTVYSAWDTGVQEYNTLLSIANDIELDRQYIKVMVRNDNVVGFAIEQFADSDIDINHLLPRILNILESCVVTFSERTTTN